MFGKAQKPVGKIDNSGCFPGNQHGRIMDHRRDEEGCQSAAANLSHNEPPRLTLMTLGAEQRDAALTLWRNLEEWLGSRRLTCSAAWIDTWLSVYGSQIPHHFLFASQQGQMVGAALATEGVHQKDGPLKLRTRHLGTAGEPDAETVLVEYNTLLVHPSAKQQFLKVIIQTWQTAGNWDALRLDGFEAEDLAAFCDADHGWAERQVVSHYYDLALAREQNVEPLGLLSTSMKRSLRRKMRAAEPYVLEWAATRDHALELYEQLVQLHQARWTSDGEPGCYSQPRFCQFHRQVAERLAPAGRAAFVALKHADEVVAAAELLIDDRRVLQYQKGWNPNAERLSPGLVLDALCIAEAQKRGYDAFDFLGGDTDYKRRLSTHHALLSWRELKPPRWKFWALDALRRTRKSLRELPFRPRESQRVPAATPPELALQAD